MISPVSIRCCGPVCMSAVEIERQMNSMGVKCALGKTRMLYRVEEHRVLEVYRMLACHKMAIRIQAWTRMIFRRRDFLFLLKIKGEFETVTKKLNLQSEEDGSI